MSLHIINVTNITQGIKDGTRTLKNVR